MCLSKLILPKTKLLNTFLLIPSVPNFYPKQNYSIHSYWFILYQIFTQNRITQYILTDSFCTKFLPKTKLLNTFLLIHSVPNFYPKHNYSIHSYWYLRYQIFTQKIVQYILIDTFGTEFLSNSKDKSEKYGQNFINPCVNYGFHCTEFYKTHSYTWPLCEDLLCGSLPRSIKKFRT
jgi:hypothetical protein